MTKILPKVNIIEAAKLLGVSPDTLRRLEKRGKIAVTRDHSGKRVYSQTDIETIRHIVKKPVSNPESITINEAAKLLGVSIDSVRRWEKQGKIRSFRTPGGHRRYSTHEIDTVKNSVKKYQPTTVSVVTTAREIVVPPQQVIQIIRETTGQVEMTKLPILYSGVHLDQSRVLGIVASVFFSVLTIVGSVKAGTMLGMFPANTEDSGQVASMKSNTGSVLQAADAVPTFRINIASEFGENSLFEQDVEIQGDLTLGGNLVTTGALTVNSLITEAGLTAGTDLGVNGGDITSTQTTFNLLNETVTTLNIGGAATALNLGATTGTTTIKNAFNVDGATTLDSTLAVSGKITASGDLAVSGTTTLASTTISALTLSGDLVLSDGNTLNIGGNGSTVAYNIIGDSSSGASASVDTDDDLYIEGNLEVDGNIIGTITGGINPGFTEGSVLFQSGSAIGGDATNFFWDDSSNRLGIGTATPGRDLDVAGDVTLGGATTDLITFTGRITSGTSLIPAVNLGSDLGTSSLKFNNIYAANLSLDSGITASGQLLTTYDPTDTTFAESSIRVNVTAPSTNEQMLGIGQAGEERAAIDAEGDLTLGYDGSASSSVPTTSNPLMIYGHDTTNVLSVSTAGTVSAAGVYTGTSGTNLRLQATGTGLGSTGTGSIYLLDSSGTTRGRFDTVDTRSDFGDGSDGSLALTASLNMNTTDSAASIDGNTTFADGIAYKVDMSVAFGTNTVTTSDTPSGIAAGDEVMLINLQGTTGDLNDVGNYEFLEIASIATNTITFSTNIQNSYDGSTPANQKVVIQRIPQYTDVTLTSSGSMTASAWEGLTTTPTGAAGYLTGIVAFRATGTVSIASGTSITTAGLGFPGGTAGAAGQNGGNNGESYEGANGKGGSGASNDQTSGGGKSATGTTASPANQATRGGGGGGGSTGTCGSANCGGAGGGGGGHAGGGGGGGAGGGTGGSGGAAGASGTFGSSGGGGGGATTGGGGGAGGAAGASGTSVIGTGGAAGSGQQSGSGGGGANSAASGGGAGGGGGGHYGDQFINTLSHGSGGGGGGGSNSPSTAGGDGGDGGGIVFVAADTLTIAGTISTNGSAGTAGTTAGGAGGGGAGGTAYIASRIVELGQSFLTSSGASGGAASTRGGAGGAGSNGYVTVNYILSANGATSPTAVIEQQISDQAKSLLGSSAYGVFHTGSVNTTSADLAEKYPSQNILYPSEIVEFDPERPGFVKLASSNKSSLAGIVSSDPGLILGSQDIEETNESGITQYPIALSGRVPVKIASDSAEIKIGDLITISDSNPGMGEKLDKPGYYVAKSLENWTPENGISRINVFVSNGYFIGNLSDNGSLEINDSISVNNLNVNDNNNLWERIFGLSNTEVSEATDSGELATDSGELNVPLEPTDTSFDITDALESLVGRLESIESDITLIKNQDLVLGTSTESGVLNSSQVNSTSLLTASDIVVTNGINVGGLSLTDNSIDAIGTLKLQGNTIEIDINGNLNIKSGVIVGNDKIRGRALLHAGESSIDINTNWESAPKSINLTPSYDTTIWYSDESQNGFKINVGSTPSTDQEVDWFAIW